jgi:acetylornithine deacetylase
MDSLETLAFARSLIDIDSTTGREAEAGQWLAARLAALGYNVLEQKIARGCANVLATIDDPVVVFSTHFDCVPPFFPSRVENGRLIGRGACDAKGILAVQVAAAERLRASGERRVGLLFVVGEERGSDGAVAANTLPNQCRFLINGEPTDSRLATATRGNLRVRLEARGRAAHSCAPEQGESAIDKLVDALVELRALPLPVDPDLGSTFYSIGLIEGGVAPNVIPAHASAEVMFRTIGSADDILTVLGALKPRVQISEVLRVRPIRMHTVPGFETHVFPFTTDVPFLDRWGTPLLFGPGSILVAHTDGEFVTLEELHAAVDGFERLARGCLAAVPSRT